MKLIRTAQTEPAADQEQDLQPAGGKPWRVLVVDDEPDIHTLTQLNLRGFSYAGRTLELLHAGSEQEARTLLQQEQDIAVALIDVVMETDNAGLQLVEHIRNDLNNRMMRLIIRTGQPGVAPERDVINNYDIDDYKDKTELTAQKLYTTVRTALKAYHDLKVIDANRRGLDLILSVTPKLYLQQQEMSVFFSGVLTQVASLCNVDTGIMDASLNGFVATLEGTADIHAGIGEFATPQGQNRAAEINRLCLAAVKGGSYPAGLPDDSLFVPLAFHEQTIGYIYLEGFSNLEKKDDHLVHVLANQVSGALLNQMLQNNLREANQHALHMLAVASEYKDVDTGKHIQRIHHGTTLLALACGVPPETAGQYGEASILHDLGKLGIPDAILQKPARLTPEEFDTIKQHTVLGEGIIGDNPWFDLARQCSISHHEHWDGNGYPNRLKGEEIPLIGRIVAVIDVFDALTSKRPYKEPWDIVSAVAEIERCSGTQFDPVVVSAFLRLYSDGSLGRLA
jgi:response regulator RpfG family c-di-GMP phosphodiesterase